MLLPIMSPPVDTPALDTALANRGFSRSPTGAISVPTPTFDTLANAKLATISLLVLTVTTAGYNSIGDGGRANYARVATQPVHAGKFQSADGSWWELREVVVDPRMFGAIPDGANADGTDNPAATDNTAAINAAVFYASQNNALNRPTSTNFDAQWLGGLKVIKFNPGFTRTGSVYGVANRIWVMTGIHYIIEKGAEVRALSNFGASGTAAPAPGASSVTLTSTGVFEGATVAEVAAGAYRPRRVAISLYGTINCNQVATSGIQGWLGNNWFIKGYSGSILWPATFGARFGSTSQGSEGMYEVYIESADVQFFAPATGTGTNDPNSVCIAFDKCQDSRVHHVVTVGGRRGFRSAGGGNLFTSCHSWGGGIYGPLIASYTCFGSGDVRFIDCTGDGIASGKSSTIGGSGGRVAVFECYGSCTIQNATFIHATPETYFNANEHVLVYAPGVASNGSRVDVQGNFTVKRTNGSVVPMGELFYGSQKDIRVQAAPIFINGAYYKEGGSLPLGNVRNMAPNRDFSMWSRGEGPTNIVTATAGTLVRTADDWFVQANTVNGSRTIQRDQLTDHVAQGLAHRSVAGFAQTVDPGDNGGWALVTQRPYEDLAEMAGKTITIAFKARLASGTTTKGLSANVYSYFGPTGSGNSAGVSSANSDTTAVPTTSWTQYVMRVVVPTIDALTMDPTRAYAQVQIQLPNVGVYKLQIAEMIISAGNLWQDFQVPTRVEVSTPQSTTRSFLGQVATGCGIPNTFNSSFNQIRFRNPHLAMDDIVSLQLVFPNFLVDATTPGAEKGPGGAASILAGIEYPFGVYTRVTFSGVNQGTIANNGLLVSDPVSVTIPRLSAFWTLGSYYCASGLIYRANTGANINAGWRAQYGAGNGGSDPSTTGFGTAANGGGNPSYQPVAIIGNTRRGSVILLGDSRFAGTGDTLDGHDLDAGIGRCLSGTVPVINAGCPSDTLQAFLAGKANRIALASYASSAILNLGINDMANGRTAAQIQADKLSVRNNLLASQPVYLTTHEPASTSSDSFATVANQTVRSYEAVRTAMNTWGMDTARGANFAGCFDLCADVENGGMNATGKWNVGMTADGIHRTQAGYRSARDNGAISPYLFGR